MDDILINGNNHSEQEQILTITLLCLQQAAVKLSANLVRPQFDSSGSFLTTVTKPDYALARHDSLGKMWILPETKQKECAKLEELPEYTEFLVEVYAEWNFWVHKRSPSRSNDACSCPTHFWRNRSKPIQGPFKAPLLLRTLQPAKTQYKR